MSYLLGDFSYVIATVEAALATYLQNYCMAISSGDKTEINAVKKEFFARLGEKYGFDLVWK